MEKLDEIAENTGIIPDIYAHLLRSPRKNADSVDATKEAGKPIADAITNSNHESDDIVDALEDAVGELTKAIASVKPVVVVQSLNSSAVSRDTVNKKNVSANSRSSIADNRQSSTVNKNPSKRVVSHKEPSDSGSKSELKTRDESGRFVSKSRDAAKDLEEKKERRGLFGLLSKSVEISQALQAGSGGDAADAAGTAVGGVYWGAINEAAEAVSSIKDSSLYSRIRERSESKKNELRKNKDRALSVEKSETKVSNSKPTEKNSNVIKPDTSKSPKPKRESSTTKSAKSKRHKKAAIQADKSTVEIEKSVVDAADSQKTGQDKSAKQHKELIETIEDSAKQSSGGLLAALSGMAAKALGIKQLTGIGGAASSAGGIIGGKEKPSKAKPAGKKGKLAILAGALTGGAAAAKSALSSGKHKDDKSAPIERPTTTKSKISKRVGAVGGIKGLGPISALLGSLSIVANELNDSLSRKEKTESNGESIGRLGASAVGAAIGTLIFPGVGTVIGGLAGDYFAGDAAGDLGKRAGEWFHSADLSSIKESISTNVSAMTDKFKASELGTMLMPRFEAISAELSNASKGISNLASSAMTNFNGFIDGLKQSDIATAIKSGFDTLTADLGNAKTTFSDWVAGLSSAKIGQSLEEAAQRFSAGFDETLAEIKSSAFGKALSDIGVRLSTSIDETILEIKSSAFGQAISDISARLGTAIDTTIEDIKKSYESIDIKKSVADSFSSANSAVKETTGVDVGAIAGAVGGIVADTGGYLYRKVFGDSSKPANKVQSGPKTSEDRIAPNSPETARWLEIDRQERQKSELEHVEKRLSMEAEASQAIIKSEKAAHEAKKDKKPAEEKPKNIFVSLIDGIKKKAKEAYSKATKTSTSGPAPKRTAKAKKDNLTAKQRANLLLSEAVNAGITDKTELANFMGQSEHESQGFNRMTENMSYSSSRLLEVFPGRNGMKTKADADAIAAGGQKSIANHVYGGKWGKDNLGNTMPNDGWNYRARGFKHLTGRTNYTEASKATGYDLVNSPELAAQPEIAAKVATWYWQSRVPKEDRKNVTAATKKINGGYNGLADRKRRAGKWDKKLANKDIPSLAARPVAASVKIASSQVRARSVPANAVAANSHAKARSVKTPDKSVNAETPNNGTQRHGVIGPVSTGASADSRLIVAALQRIEVLTKNNSTAKADTKTEKASSKVAPNIPVDIEDAYWQRMEGGSSLT